MKVRPELEKRFPAVWETMATAGVICNSSSCSTNGTADVKLDLTQLPLVSAESGEKVCIVTDTVQMCMCLGPVIFTKMPSLMYHHVVMACRY
jgi:hypothetical protein